MIFLVTIFIKGDTRLDQPRGWVGNRRAEVFEKGYIVGLQVSFNLKGFKYKPVIIQAKKSGSNSRAGHFHFPDSKCWLDSEYTTKTIGTQVPLNY